MMLGETLDVEVATRVAMIYAYVDSPCSSNWVLECFSFFSQNKLPLELFPLDRGSSNFYPGYGILASYLYFNAVFEASLDSVFQLDELCATALGKRPGSGKVCLAIA